MSDCKHAWSSEIGKALGLTDLYWFLWSVENSVDAKNPVKIHVTFDVCFICGVTRRLTCEVNDAAREKLKAAGIELEPAVRDGIPELSEVEYEKFLAQPTGEPRVRLATYLKFGYGGLYVGMNDEDWLREADDILKLLKED